MTTPRAIKVHAHLHADPVDTVVLDHDQRHRRRVVLKGRGGFEFLLDLPEATHIRDGAALILEDGREIEVEAAPEPLAEIAPNGAWHAQRIAWHLGNRHLPTMFDGVNILIRRDHVIEAMVAGLGARVTHVEKPFDPESGAYAGAGGHGHGHGHADHGHHHHHGHASGDHDH